MDTVMTNMAFARFYASIYAGSLQFGHPSDEVIVRFRNDMKILLPEFYAAVLVVSVKAVRYFERGKVLPMVHCVAIIYISHLLYRQC